MCGRFAFYTPAEAVAALFDAEFEGELAPSYNIAPTQLAPVVRRGEDGRRSLRGLRWGLVPFWAKDAAIGNRMINARAETLAEKPAFRRAFRKQRCLVLANGFYEWQKGPDGKTPWFISSPHGAPLALAGMWERWRAADDAPTLDTCTIITTRPNDMMSALHNRMPAILAGPAVERWLDPATDVAELAGLLEPVADDMLQAVPVSRRVNSPANNDAGLLDAISPQSQ
jgi:putative SOS response-associated peptidase YedK